MRFIPLFLATTGCFLFGRGDTPQDGDDTDGEGLYLRSCDITCEEDGVDLEIGAIGADEAEVELWLEASLAATFELTRLDDTTWVAYEEWPNGLSFDDCLGDDDWVCVIRNGDDEVREAQ